MFDGAAAAAYNHNQRLWEHADPRLNGHGPKRVILAVTYSRYDGGEVQATCPACGKPATAGIYPGRLEETLRFVAAPAWVCERCAKENAQVLQDFDRADGYGPPEPRDFEDDLPF